MQEVVKWAWWLYNRPRWLKLYKEATSLVVLNKELRNGIHTITLEDGHTFLGSETTELDQFSLKRVESLWGEREWFGVLSDIITRYKYPQPLPVVDKIESRWVRGGYSKHLANSVWDNPYPNKVELLDRFIPKKDWVAFDCGAYLGYATLRLSEILSEGKVISWECSPENLKYVKAHLGFNKVSNVNLIDRAVWSHRGSQLNLGEGESQTRSLVYGTGGQLVSTDSIDNVVEELHLNRVDFISLTVNGAEYEALKGAKRTLKEFRPCLSVTGWVNKIYEPCCRLLENLGYNFTLTIDKRILAWKEGR